MLSYLTGKSYDDWDVVIKSDRNLPWQFSYRALAMEKKPDEKNTHLVLTGFGLAGIFFLIRWRDRKRNGRDEVGKG